VDSRVPIAIALMALAGLDVEFRRSARSTALIGLVVLSILIKQSALAILWRSFDEPIDTIIASLDALPDSAIVMQSECQPDALDIMAVYRARQPSMSHLSAFAGFKDTRFVAKNWAIAGQHPIKVASAYLPYYRLQSSFDDICRERGLEQRVDAIAALADARMDAGAEVPPLYFLVIRPRLNEALGPKATLISRGPAFELYRLTDPRAHRGWTDHWRATDLLEPDRSAFDGRPFRSRRSEAIAPKTIY